MFFKSKRLTLPLLNTTARQPLPSDFTQKARGLVREANDRGYECLLIEDATESYFPQFKQATLDMITAQGGIVGWVAKSAQVKQGLEAAYG